VEQLSLVSPRPPPIGRHGLYGYLKRWLVDIGDRVKEGQLIAEISAPDVDDQLAQARANLALAQANLQVSQANLELAKVTLDRDTKAGPGTATSFQQIDQDRVQVKTTAAQVESARASIQVNQATVQQYADLQSFEKIVAPFPGVITSRSARWPCGNCTPCRPCSNRRCPCRTR